MDSHSTDSCSLLFSFTNSALEVFSALFPVLVAGSIFMAKLCSITWLGPSSITQIHSLKDIYVFMAVGNHE